jgi:hypothetical protein
MKGNHPLKGEIIAKGKKYTENFWKSSSPEPAGKYSNNLSANHFFCYMEFKIVQINGQVLFKE